MSLAERDHWLSFLPWPQALLGHVLLARGDLVGAEACLGQSFARACQIGDPCWEGISARGLALVAEADGRTAEAFDTLLDARSRASRVADPYVWLDVHVLDALCTLGRAHEHPMTREWVDAMRERASRTGMRELTVRALLHSSALGDAGESGGSRKSGDAGDGEAAALLAAEVDNDVLAALLP